MRMFSFRRVAIASLLSMVVLSMGCSNRSKYIIPQQKSAREQFVFAMSEYKNYLSPLSISNHSTISERCIASLQTVIDNFPNEMEWNRRSRMYIAMIYDRENKDKKALAMYEKLLIEAPDEEDIQINCLYGAAIIYDQREEYSVALDYYRRIMDRYGEKTDSAYGPIVRDCRIRYNKVRKND
jgi:tetratricopeptide (TPR) repeat protein